MKHANLIRKFRDLFLVLALSAVLVRCAEDSTSSSSNCTSASFTTNTSGKEIAIGDLTLGGTTLAQSFKVSSDTKVTAVSATLMVVGGFSSSDENKLTLTIETDSNDSPGGNSAVQATGTLLCNKVTSTTGSSYGFTLDKVAYLKKDTTYWIRIKASYAPSSAKVIKWAGHEGDSSGYPDGHAAYETETQGTWSTTQIGTFRDLAFSLTCTQ